MNCKHYLILFNILFFNIVFCFSEDWNDCYLSEGQYFYTSSKIEYAVKKETTGLFENTSASNIKLKENDIINDVTYFWGPLFDEEGDMIKSTPFHAIKFQNLYYLEDDFYIKGSDCLPEEILIKTALLNKNKLWIPAFFNDLQKSGSMIPSIYSYLPELKHYASETDVPWYKVNNLSFPLNVSFRNTRMTVSYIYDSCDFLFTRVKKLDENNYEIECYPEQGRGFEELKNISFLKPFYQKKHILKLGINGNHISIYENGNKLLDLLSVTSDWVKEFQEDIRHSSQKN